MGGKSPSLSNLGWPESLRVEAMWLSGRCGSGPPKAGGGPSAVAGQPVKAGKGPPDPWAAAAAGLPQGQKGGKGKSESRSSSSGEPPESAVAKPVSKGDGQQGAPKAPSKRVTFNLEGAGGKAAPGTPPPTAAPSAGRSPTAFDESNPTTSANHAGHPGTTVRTSGAPTPVCQPIFSASGPSGTGERPERSCQATRPAA